MMFSDGDKIGPYTIRGTVGQGGMATVYKAWHEGLHRFEALKVPRGAGGSAPDSAFVVRLLTEARVAAGLHHPNIVAIHGVSEPQAPIPYFAMDWVEGRDLAKVLAEKRVFSLADTLEILEHVAAGLDYAHSQGVVHRDIKPANILIGDKNGLPFPRVVDFGISRAAEDEDGATKLTKSGMIVGTPEYMSPEQAGSGEIVDYRTDIYSLAVVAYEMLCGAPPFTAGDGVSRLSILISHVRDIAPLFQRCPDFPRAAGDVLLKALSKTPATRPQSCASFVSELRAAAPGDGTFISCPEPNRAERTPFDSSRFSPVDDATVLERSPFAASPGPQTMAPSASAKATAVDEGSKVMTLRERLEAAQAERNGPKETPKPEVSVPTFSYPIPTSPQPAPASPPTPLPRPASLSANESQALSPVPSVAADVATPVEAPPSAERPASRVALLAGFGGLFIGAALVFALLPRGGMMQPVPSSGTSNQLSINQPQSITPLKTASSSAPRVRVERERVIRNVPFATVTQRSDARPSGSQFVAQPGKNGEREVVFEVTYRGPKEVTRRVLEQNLLRPAVSQVIVVGTRHAALGRVVARVEPHIVQRDSAPRRVRTDASSAPRRIRPAVVRRPARRPHVREAPLPP